LVEALRGRAERILPFTGGGFAPSPPPVLLNKLTDQLLVVASDAVSAVATGASPPLSGKAALRLLAWVVADARGATTPLEKALADTVGKRLEKQAQKVRETLAAATAEAAEAREAARTAAAQDASLAAALASELAAIDAVEHGAYERARDEVYVGFHELGSSSTPASGPLSVSAMEPQPLPAYISEEPEEGPVRDGLLQRALAQNLDQQSKIDVLERRLQAMESTYRQQHVAWHARQTRDAREFYIMSKELIEVEHQRRSAEREREYDREDEAERWEEREKAIREEYASYERILRERSQKQESQLRDRIRVLGAEVQRLSGS
jgi:hypothetical protein